MLFIFHLTFLTLTFILLLNMTISDLRQFIDLGGVFILAMVLLNQWGARFGAIEDKLTRLTALICLSIKDKVSDEKIEEVLTKPTLEVLPPIK